MVLLKTQTNENIRGKTGFLLVLVALTSGTAFVLAGTAWWLVAAYFLKEGIAAYEAAILGMDNEGGENVSRIEPVHGY